MIRSILTALLLSTSTPVLAQGVWIDGQFYPNASAADAALCKSVAAELQDGVDEGLFSPDYAAEVLKSCLAWATP